MYKDAADKLLHYFKEYSFALSDLNKLIASYVLHSKDYIIATQVNKELDNISGI